MGYQVALSSSAQRDLRDIVRYISFDSPDRAISFGQFLVDNTKRLADFPQLGRAVPEFENALIREIVVRSYRVVYRIDECNQRIEVIRFWHAARGNPEL
jgi:plasmid stabilization system protein ParE